jgi:hypothetical protein
MQFPDATMDAGFFHPERFTIPAVTPRENHRRRATGALPVQNDSKRLAPSCPDDQKKGKAEYFL